MTTMLLGISLLLTTFAHTVHAIIMRRRIKNLEELVTELWKDAL